MTDTFPAVGHKYLVAFKSQDGARRFRVQLDFHSLTSLTYTGVGSDGALSGDSETVTITVDPIRDLLFLVTWKEQFGTTVVHLEDYTKNSIITNITSPSDDPRNPDFSTFHGTFTQVS
jgi:hypothetical protein